MTVNHGAGGAALGLKGVPLCHEPAKQTNWAAVSAASAGDTAVVLRSVSYKGFISHDGFRVVLGRPGIPNSGQLADLLEERVASPGCLLLPVPANFASPCGV